ncbi:hypothetical protein [Pseudomonas chlororaphis]|uniref:hypothetical protein n=1 Tax=Pseudomonas chlororaphis TaxID=587753 RepID=UPI000F55F998|nr:hypothetical protein [Pseudomonas chlororaphis]
MTPNIAFQWFTPIFTIFAGILIFIVSQAVLKLMIEPVQQLKGAIGLTANTLLRQRSKITNGVENAELSAKIFDHAAELVSKAEVIICYRLEALTFRLPPKANIVKAARELNGVAHATRDKRPPGTRLPASPSSALSADKNHLSLKEIEKLLRVKTDYE